MAISSTIITDTLKQVMAAVNDAQGNGIACFKPGALMFHFPLDADGSAVDFEIRVDWYSITKDTEDALWPKQ